MEDSVRENYLYFNEFEFRQREDSEVALFHFVLFHAEGGWVGNAERENHLQAISLFSKVD